MVLSRLHKKGYSILNPHQYYGVIIIAYESHLSTCRDVQMFCLVINGLIINENLGFL